MAAFVMIPPIPRELRPGVHLLETEMEGFDVRSAVLLGSARAVVWDVLAHPDQVAPVERLAGVLPRTVVYSHADWDHAWGTCGLRDVEDVVAHQAALTRLESDAREELERRQATDADAWGVVRLVAPTRTFADRLDLDLGDATVELHALTGHTADSIVAFVPAWGLLLAGDAVETPLPVVNDPTAVERWVAALDGWLGDERARTVVPSHGPVGGPELLERTASYLRELTRGRAPTVPDDLAPFYRETHEENVRLMRAFTG